MIYTSYNLSDIAEYCSKELGINKYEVDIYVSECCLKDDGAWGWCYDLDDGEIDIEIDKNISPKDKMITLCHEMVHALQVCRGDETFCEDEANNLEEELYNGFLHTT